MSVSASQRFHKKDRACPVCGGYDYAPRHKGIRCHRNLS
jgi:hypothetical protein